MVDVGFTILILASSKKRAEEQRILVKNAGYPAQTVSSLEELSAALKRLEDGFPLLIAEIELLKGEMDLKEVLPAIILVEEGDEQSIEKINFATIYCYIAKGTEELTLIPSLKRTIFNFKLCKQEKVLHKKTIKELEALIDHLPCPIFYKDKENRFIRVNRYIADKYNMTTEELRGKSLYELHAKDDADRYLEDDLEVIRSGKPKLYYVESWETDEGTRWVSTSKIPYFDSRGECIGIIGISTDQTELKQTELALMEQGRLYEAILNNISDYIVRFDQKGHVLYANPAVIRVGGFPTDSYKMHTLSELGATADFCSLLNSKLEMAFTRKEIIIFSFKTVIARKELFLEAKLCPELDSEGQVISVIGIARDLTERNRADQQRLILATAIEQAEEVVVITDPQGNINYVNPALEEITGYSRAEVLNKNPRLFKSGSHPEDFYKDLWSTICSGHTWRGRMVNKRKDGSLYTEEATISPVRDGGGNIVYFVAVKRDISKELELEEQYYLSQKMEAIGLLAGGVAHDLNNLLTPILGYSELLEEDISDFEMVKEAVNEIKEAGHKARELVGQLLAFGRKQALEAYILDLNQIIEEFYKLLRRTLHEDIKLDCTLQKGLPNIKADRGKLEQVIMNICVNAQYAMPDGGSLFIKTEEVNLDESYSSQHRGVVPGRYIMMSISDTGCGMSRDTCDKIFEPFYTTRGPGKGTGLGLSTVYGIIKQHGGNIWVYSEEGIGTVFKIYLPYADGVEQRVVKKSKGRLKKGSETILLVEDSEKVRKLTSTILKKRGYKVLSAASSYETENILTNSKEQIDLLITDVVIPDSNGKKIYKLVSSYFPTVKVLYMSGYSNDVISHHGIIDKEIALIQKPFSVEGLLHKVREVIDNG